MTTSLVTGGCGFIGSHIVDLLIERGHRVIVFDSLTTGRISNLDRHKNAAQLQIIQDDLTNISRIKESVDQSDYVFHLAALADIVPSISDPLTYFNNNCVTTINLLEASRRADVKKFVYAASSSCYGIPENYPSNEDSPIMPRYPYALTKWMAEEAVMHWGRVYGLPSISLRLFNVYGLRSRTSGTYGAVFGVFLRQKLAGKPLTVVGDGLQTRDFIHVTDVAEAFYLAATSQVSNEVFNVGSGATYSINYLTDLLDAPKVHIAKRPGEPDCTYADITKIQKHLNWRPKVSFESGVRTMLENIDDWSDAPLWDTQSIEEATKEWFRLLG